LSRTTKLFVYTGISLFVILLAAIASLFFFKDRIIQEFISEANKSLNTPVKIGKIEISAWQDFPNLAIVFTDVYVEDSHPEDHALITAKKVSFSMNALEAWRGNYAIRGLEIKSSEASLKINDKGQNNFTVVKAAKGLSASSISFDLKDVSLIDTRVQYQDRLAYQEHLFSSEKLTASISVRGDSYKIVADGDVLSEQIKIRDRIFLKGKAFNITSQIDYDDIKKNIAIRAAKLTINQSVFEVTGGYSFREKSLINLKVEGKETSIQTILALLPSEINSKLAGYQSKGNVFFDLSLAGEISKYKDPLFSIRFGFAGATFYHPSYKSKITNAHLTGSFATPSLTDLSQAVLHLKEVDGMLNDKPFRCNLSIQNLENPYVQFNFKGELNAASIQNFYPIAAIKNSEGSLLADFSIVGQLELLKKKSTAQQVKTSGTIDLSNVMLQLAEKNINFKNVNGSLQFNNNDLAMSNFRGELGNSDFVLNGYFKNIVTFLLFDDQPIGIEADLKSTFLDADQLFKIGFGEDLTTGIKFHISPNIHLNFNCDIKRLSYKRFRPRHIKGNLLVKNQVAVSRNIEMKTMGGNLQFNGIVDAGKPTAIEISSSFKLDGIYTDSVFYVFENFGQSFIKDTHLKGQAYADVSMEMSLTENLKLVSESLVADINATLKKGELNNFEPLQGLSKYVDDEGLGNLRFADLKNEIHIENETIYIPQMEIKSNVTTLQLSGTHTFDQHIAYRIVAPLRNKKKIDPDEAFGAIEETSKGKTQVFLKISGTTDEYKISYDKDAVKKKIVSDLKKEVKELKEAFQLKGKKKKKELELEKDEYFDWEN
jgi:AsmA-like C-terminal region